MWNPDLKHLCVAAAAFAVSALSTSFASAFATSCAPAESPAEIERQLRDLQAAEVAALLAGDFDTIERLWNDGYTVNAPTNQVRNRQQVLAGFKSGQLKYDAFERTVEHVALFGDTAVVMGGEAIRPVTGPMAGKTIHRRFTDVWIKCDGRWQALARHANVVTPA